MIKEDPDSYSNTNEESPAILPENFREMVALYFDVRAARVRP